MATSGISGPTGAFPMPPLPRDLQIHPQFKDSFDEMMTMLQLINERRTQEELVPHFENFRSTFSQALEDHLSQNTLSQSALESVEMMKNEIHTLNPTQPQFMNQLPGALKNIKTGLMDIELLK